VKYECCIGSCCAFSGCGKTIKLVSNAVDPAGPPWLKAVVGNQEINQNLYLSHRAGDRKRHTLTYQSFLVSKSNSQMHVSQKKCKHAFDRCSTQEMNLTVFETFGMQSCTRLFRNRRWTLNFSKMCATLLSDLALMGFRLYELEHIRFGQCSHSISIFHQQFDIKKATCSALGLFRGHPNRQT
jgi:hypothetical protein